MKKYNVLIVSPRYIPVLSGAETQIHQIAKSLFSRGYNVDVITLNTDKDLYSKKKYFPDREIIDNISVKRYKSTILPAHTRLCKLLEHIKYFKYFCGYRRIFSFDLLKHNIDNYDFIILGIMPFSGIIYPMLNKARKRGIKIALIPFIHFGIPHDNRFKYEYFSNDCIELYKMSEIIIVNSDIEKEFLIKNGYKGEIIQINPYIDIECENNDSIDNTFCVCTLGYNNYEKGIETSIKAFNRFSVNKNNVRFEIAGIIEEKYSEIAKNNNRIIVHGQINYDEKIQLFKRCSLFIQPSMAESLGIATLEAHRCSIPSINTFCSGSMSIIENNKNGFLIPFGDDYLLYEYMEILYNDRAKLNTMGKYAKQMSYKYDYNNHIKGIRLLERFIK